jgi:Zn-finger nucleic acid-binding protein
MKCPVDSTDLVMSDRQGVEIDYCPTCRGVWLDRGELDKIIDRSADAGPTGPEARETRVTQPQASGGIRGKVEEAFRDRDDDSYRRRDDDDDYTYDKNGKRKKKRGGFLEDLFDF